jgi:hypothetical protein
MKTIVAAVFHFQNGMTMAFNEFGQQIPELQGKTEGHAERCREHADRFDFSACTEESNVNWREFRERTA